MHKLQRDVRTLKEFYSLMADNRTLRVEIVEKIFKGKAPESDEIEGLKATLHSLCSIPQKEGEYSLEIDPGKSIAIDLTYEITELEKDLIYLERGEVALLEYLEGLHSGFSEEVHKGIGVLRNAKFDSFITDRDGTTNNYCGRYRSSIQSIYNSMFLSNFAQNCTKNAIFITSAPLEDPGIVDVSVNPPNTFVYAAAKGRTLIDQHGKKHKFPISDEKQKLQDDLYKELDELTQQPKYEKFALIGSGLQNKFGQITLARQDITKSATEEESMAFLKLLEEMVAKRDPEHKNFRIEDTGLDVEIILTIDCGKEGARDFDKGDGVRFLNKELNLGLEKGVHLVCGDTGSDVPMAQATVEFSKETWSVFVTENPDLIKKVQSASPNSLIVSTPDVLVTILNELSKR